MKFTHIQKKFFFKCLPILVLDDEKADSASSGSSILAEPACTQLLNHRNVYHHITKNEEIEVQVDIFLYSNRRSSFNFLFGFCFL